MSIFAFELKKVLFSKRFIYTLLVLVALVIGIFIRNLLFTDLVLEQEKDTVKVYTREVQSNLRELNAYLERNPNDEKKEAQYQGLAQALNLIYEWNQLVGSDNWRATLQKEIDFFNALLEYKKLGGEYSLTISEINRTIALAEQHLSVGIKPESEQYSTVLPIFMKLITTIYVNLGAILLVLLIIGDSLTSEFEQRSIQFLYTQPLKKSSIVHAKYGTAVFSYVIVTAAIYLTTWILPLLVGKSGTFLYPVLLNDTEQFRFITIGEYIQWSLLGMSITILMVVSFTLLISTFTKHTIVTLLIVLLALVGGYFGLDTVLGDSINWINPFALVFAGLTVLKIDSTWSQSIPIILIFALLLYIGTLIKMKRSY